MSIWVMMGDVFVPYGGATETLGATLLFFSGRKTLEKAVCSVPVPVVVEVRCPTGNPRVNDVRAITGTKTLRCRATKHSKVL
jgi:hypothetical protein